MFEKVNPSHPDKIADRIAGAIVDLAYKNKKDPKIAVEVLIGHGKCTIIAETSEHFENEQIEEIVERITGKEIIVYYTEVPQDEHLAKNQDGKLRCGDNGIFKGVPLTREQVRLARIVRALYEKFPTDGKYVIETDSDGLSDVIACQSNVDDKTLTEFLIREYKVNSVRVNPLGSWTGGISVDTGATNRKLGSDMGDAVTGGGLHGKDLSKADVSVNIYAYIRANQLRMPIEFSCAIGDEYIDGIPYSAIVEVARDYIFNVCGGFEKFAEWGLI